MVDSHNLTSNTMSLFNTPCPPTQFYITEMLKEVYLILSLKQLMRLLTRVNVIDLLDWSLLWEVGEARVGGAYLSFQKAKKRGLSVRD